MRRRRQTGACAPWTGCSKPAAAAVSSSPTRFSGPGATCTPCARTPRISRRRPPPSSVVRSSDSRRSISGSNQEDVPVLMTADRLRRVTSAILKSGGSAAGEADLVADHLVQANLAGHDSHGVGMIPTYVRHLQMGLVVPNARVKLVKDDGAILMFDGGRGYGRPMAGEAMAGAIERCRQT